MSRLRKSVQALVRHHRVVELFLHGGAIATAGLVAFLLRFEFSIPATHLKHLAWGIGVWVVVKLVMFVGHGLHRSWWRYVGVEDVVRLAQANAAGSAVATGLLLIWDRRGFRGRFTFWISFCVLG